MIMQLYLYEILGKDELAKVRILSKHQQSRAKRLSYDVQYVRLTTYDTHECLYI